MVLLPTIICPLTQSPAINGELIAEEEARQLSFVVNNLNGRTMHRNDTTVDNSIQATVAAKSAVLSFAARSIQWRLKLETRPSICN